MAGRVKNFTRQDLLALSALAENHARLPRLPNKAKLSLAKADND